VHIQKNAAPIRRMFAIGHLKNNVPTSLMCEDANVREYKIITIQLLSTVVMVRTPKHISWSHGSQTICNVLQLQNTVQKPLTRERT
jgi:hypothetical protein